MCIRDRSYATPEQASKIIANLSQDTRVDVVERIANMDRALPMAIKIAEEVLEKKIGSSSSEETMEVGGLNYIADVMNHVDRLSLIHIFSLCGGFRCITTYEIQNHPIIVNLMRRHGKDLNFAGVLITVTSVEAKHRYLVSKMAANLLKEVFHADGVIVTKGVGGASTLCVGAIASEAEKLGIKAVPVIQILNGKSNLGIECMISEKNVDSIVCSGTYYHNFTLPPVETLLGGPQDALYLSGDDGVIGGHKIATGDPAKGQVRSTYMKQVGLMSQIGYSHGMAVDY